MLDIVWSKERHLSTYSDELDWVSLLSSDRKLNVLKYRKPMSEKNILDCLDERNTYFCCIEDQSFAFYLLQRPSFC